MVLDAGAEPTPSRGALVPWPLRRGEHWQLCADWATRDLIPKKLGEKCGLFGVDGHGDRLDRPLAAGLRSELGRGRRRCHASSLLPLHDPDKQVVRVTRVV